MRKVISYDFDGCLHTTVDGHDPIEWFDHLMWEPFEKVHKQLREDAKAFKEATLWKNGEEFFTFGDLAESSALEQMLIHAIERINFNEFSRETELLRKCQMVGESNINFGL